MAFGKEIPLYDPYDYNIEDVVNDGVLFPGWSEAEKDKFRFIAGRLVEFKSDHPDPLLNGLRVGYYLSDRATVVDLPAFAAGLLHKNGSSYEVPPSITVSKLLLTDHYSIEELEAVIGHELGHVMLGDLRLASFSDSLYLARYMLSSTAGFSSGLRDCFLSETLSQSLNDLMLYFQLEDTSLKGCNWSQKREYNADQYVRYFGANPESLMSALSKIAADTLYYTSLYEQISTFTVYPIPLEILWMRDAINWLTNVTLFKPNAFQLFPSLLAIGKTHPTDNDRAVKLRSECIGGDVEPVLDTLDTNKIKQALQDCKTDDSTSNTNKQPPEFKK